MRPMRCSATRTSASSTTRSGRTGRRSAGPVRGPAAIRSPGSRALAARAAGGQTGQAGNVRYEFRSSGDPGEFSDFFRMFFGGEGGFADVASARPGAGRAGGSAGTIDLEDFLAGMGAGVQSGRGRATSGPARPAAKPRHEAQAEITLDEAFHGTTRLVDVDGKRLEITIPPGADTGTRIRLTGKGPGGGDLHIVVRQRPDATFTRKGADLERELPITLEGGPPRRRGAGSVAEGRRCSSGSRRGRNPDGSSGSAAAACRSSAPTATAICTSAPRSSFRQT